MNRIFITLSIFIVLFTNCTSPKPKESTLKVQVNAPKHLNSNKPKESTLKIRVKVNNKLNSEEYKKMEGAFYSTDIYLINDTDSTIHFWMMSCSWMDNMRFSTDKAYLYKWGGCNKNVPELKQIEPGQKITYNGITCIRNTSFFRSQNDVKLGFVLIRKGETSGNSDFERVLSDKIKSKKDFIWSNAFKIKE
jgi:hypothetical protein